MIRLEDLPAGAVAYLDAEWVALGLAGDVAALVVEDRTIRFGDSPSHAVRDGLDGESAAALALQSLAAAAARAALEAGGPVEVTGHGLVAREVRRRVAGPGDDERGARPAAVVETTGDPAAIEAATRQVANLGTLVLAGEPLGRSLDLDLYSDVHVRGLRVVGVSPPLLDGLPESPGTSSGVPEPARLRLGEPLPAGAEWVAVSL